MKNVFILNGPPQSGSPKPHGHVLCEYIKEVKDVLGELNHD